MSNVKSLQKYLHFISGRSSIYDTSRDGRIVHSHAVHKENSMAEEFKPGCARPTGGPVGTEPEEQDTSSSTQEESTKGGKQSMIMVGKKAPDFTAPAYQQGKFINVKLSDYLGKWVVLCFYPGDFTFV